MQCKNDARLFRLRLTGLQSCISGSISVGSTSNIRLWHVSSVTDTVKLAESRLGKSRDGRVKGRDEDASRPDLCRPSLPR
jgi:hypothetical protein